MCLEDGGGGSYLLEFGRLKECAAYPGAEISAEVSVGYGGC